MQGHFLKSEDCENKQKNKGISAKYCSRLTKIRSALYGRFAFNHKELSVKRDLCRTNLIFITFFSVLFIFLKTNALAQEAPKRILKAISAETQKIKIDGFLNEALWQIGDPADQFIQQEPHVGAPALAQSFVRMAYDENHLYIAAILNDPQPEKIHADERQEDSPFDRSDAFAVLIDTYHDHQNGFFFESNPLSAMSDALVSQEGAAINRDWDGRWQVAARRTAKGWAVEFKIPFETLRFRSGKTQTWGIQFRRRVPHLKEISFWSPLSIEQNFFEISRSGHLEGIETTHKTKPFSLKPYVRSSYQRDKSGTNNRSDTDFDGGLDLRYQIRSNLALDLTWNTDFAETEVDRFRNNLTRFPLFFPEKREFFLEGKGFYDFGLSRRVQPFFSRRIGLVSGQAIPILGGGKLSGKVGPYGIGALVMQTEEEGESPAEQFGVLRLSRDLGLRSNLGLIVTERAERGGSGRETLGVDTTFAPHTHLTTNAFWLRSDDQNGTAGIAQFAELDWRDPFWRIRLNHLRVGENFDPALGFVQQSDLDETVGFIDMRPQAKSGLIRELGFKSEITYQRDTQNNFLYQSNYNRIQADFRSGDFILISVDPQRERLPDDFEIRDGIVIPAGDYEYTHSNVIFVSDARRTLSGTLDVLWGGFYAGRKTSLSFSLTAAPKEGLKIGGGWDVDWVRLPQGDFSSQILNGDIAWSFSNSLLFQSLFQWDKEEKSLAANLRLSWEYRDQSWFYFIVNPSYQNGNNSVLVLTKLTFRWDP